MSCPRLPPSRLVSSRWPADSGRNSESLQYVLESVPIVDRAFVHADYATYNLPTHMEQQSR